MKHIPKFRAWDKVNQTMENGSIVWSLLQDCEDIGWDDFIFMQSTGRKDKNGKEIYEGDIVIRWSKYRKKNDTTDFYPSYTTKKMITFTSKPRQIGFNMGNKVIYEIIGNIYENSELIK